MLPSFFNKKVHKNDAFISSTYVVTNLEIGITLKVCPFLKVHKYGLLFSFSLTYLPMYLPIWRLVTLKVCPFFFNFKIKIKIDNKFLEFV
jgi:hypothetical protein